MSAPRISVVAYGDRGTLIDLGRDGLDRAARTRSLAAEARATWPSADVVVGGGTVAVLGVDADAVARSGLGDLAPEAARRAIDAPLPPSRSHRFQAVYDGADLAEVAATLGISTTELVARHAAAEHTVELVGFLPGFGYLTSPGFTIPIPRRPVPRPRVPARSLAVAASFTGIYPLSSPGGWHLLGRVVGATLFDAEREPPSLLDVGDTVRFDVSDAREEPEPASNARSPAPPPRAGLLVVRAPALATVQDLGRAGRLGRGLSPSGPLDPETFVAANLAVGNARGAAAIEIPLGTLEIEAFGAPLVVSVDGEAARAIAEGERLVVAPSHNAVRYVALRGGVDVPVVLGSRATCLSAAFGGFGGRALRRGDRIATGDDLDEAPPVPAGSPALDAPIALSPGPHVGRFPDGAYDALLRGSFRVSARSDRTGCRLEGPRVPRSGEDLALPAPMVRGAIQVTTDGTPIVLGPDHPTTGGYPVLAVVGAGSLGALARRPPGADVRFVELREGCSRPASLG